MSSFRFGSYVRVTLRVILPDAVSICEHEEERTFANDHARSTKLVTDQMLKMDVVRCHYGSCSSSFLSLRGKVGVGDFQECSK